jgi:hypothetical protein
MLIESVKGRGTTIRVVLPPERVRAEAAQEEGQLRLSLG